MTVTIEVKPKIVKCWQEIAARESRALEAVAAEVGTETLDAEDLAESRRVLTDISEPDVSWEEIKSDLRARRAAA